MQPQLDALTSLINKALSLDASATSELARFQGKSIRLTCTGPDMDVVLSVGDGVIVIGTYTHWLASAEKPVTTHLSGSFSAFLQLLASDDKAAALINLDLKLIGESALLIDLQDLLANIGIDWEYQLAQVVGDIPAHFLGSMSRSTFKWMKSTYPIFVRHVKEFVVDELSLTPSKSELDDYVTSVQKASLELERLEARLKRLERR